MVLHQVLFHCGLLGTIFLEFTREKEGGRREKEEGKGARRNIHAQR